MTRAREDVLAHAHATRRLEVRPPGQEVPAAQPAGRCRARQLGDHLVPGGLGGGQGAQGHRSRAGERDVHAARGQVRRERRDRPRVRAQDQGALWGAGRDLGHRLGLERPRDERPGLVRAEPDVQRHDAEQRRERPLDEQPPPGQRQDPVAGGGGHHGRVVAGGSRRGQRLAREVGLERPAQVTRRVGHREQAEPLHRPVVDPDVPDRAPVGDHRAAAAERLERCHAPCRVHDDVGRAQQRVHPVGEPPDPHARFVGKEPPQGGARRPVVTGDDDDPVGAPLRAPDVRRRRGRRPPTRRPTPRRGSRSPPIRGTRAPPLRRAGAGTAARRWAGRSPRCRRPRGARRVRPRRGA